MICMAKDYITRHSLSKIVEQMPIIQYNRQPTVAIITAEYCEKVAVDILIENKETFVRYTTVGKNNKI